MPLTERSIGTVSDIYGKIIEDEYYEHFPVSKHARAVVNPKCMACIGNSNGEEHFIAVPLSQVNYLELFKRKVYIY